MHELWLRIAHTSGAKIYSLLLGIASLALTARWLGPEGRGQLVAIVTWIGLFSTAGYLSLGQVAIYRAAARKDEKWVGEVTGSLLILAVMLSVMCWIIAAILHVASGGRVYGGLSMTLFTIGMAALPLYIWEQYGSALLMALEKVGVYNRAQVIGRTVAVLLIVVLLGWAGWGVTGALVATISGQAVVAAGGVILLSKFPISATRSEAVALLQGGVKLHLNAVGTFLFASADLLILNYYRGPEETAYYQLAVQLVGVMAVVPQAVAMVMYGKIAAIGADAAWPYHKTLLKQTVLLVSLGAVVAWFLAPWLVPWLVGTRFTPSIEVFRWLLVTSVGMTFSTVMAAQWVGRGLFLQASSLTLIVGVTSLSINLVLVPMYGMSGAIVAQLVTYLLSVIANGCMVVYCEKSWHSTRGLTQNNS